VQAKMYVFLRRRWKIGILLIFFDNLQIFSLLQIFTHFSSATELECMAMNFKHWVEFVNFHKF